MISISTFKAFNELPELAIKNDIGMELTKLVDPSFYDDAFLSEITRSKYSTYYNSAHGPFYDLIPPSRDIEIQNLCENKFKRAIKACKVLKIKNVIFHTGWQKDFYPDAVWIENSIRFWNRLLDQFDDETTIYIENVFENKIELIKEIITGVNKQNFKVCLDIGHLNLVDKNNITNWIVNLRDYIGHFHLHNNYGEQDNHNGLIQGTINMDKILQVIIENCLNANFNLEIKTAFQESIDFVKKYKEFS